MPTLRLSWSFSDLQAWEAKLKDERPLFRALKKAGGDAARAMKAEATRTVRNKKRFKVSRVNQGMPLQFPKGTKPGTLMWRMPVSGQAVPISSLSFRQVRKGVTFAINQGKRSMIRSAFVATMKSGHKGVFVRRGEKRLPIDEAFTTRISDVFHDRDTVPRVYKRAREVFKASFDRLLPIELSRAKK